MVLLHGSWRCVAVIRRNPATILEIEKLLYLICVYRFNLLLKKFFFSMLHTITVIYFDVKVLLYFMLRKGKILLQS